MRKLTIFLIFLILFFIVILSGVLIFIFIDPFGYNEIKYSEIEFPETIGTYKLHQFNSNNWREDCNDFPDGTIFCMRTIRAEYLDDSKNETVHIISNIFIDDKELFHDKIKQHIQVNNDGSNTYNAQGEPNEIMWFTAETLDYLGAQIYINNHRDDDSTTFRRKKIDTDNPVIAHYLKEYPPILI